MQCRIVKVIADKLQMKATCDWRLANSDGSGYVVYVFTYSIRLFFGLAFQELRLLGNPIVPVLVKSSKANLSPVAG